MDNLARDAMAARRLGVSYGKYKAMRLTAVVVKPARKQPTKKCEYCGAEFDLDSHHGRKYCCDD